MTNGRFETDAGRELCVLGWPGLAHPVKLKVQCLSLVLRTDELIRQRVNESLGYSMEDVNRRYIEDFRHTINHDHGQFQAPK